MATRGTVRAQASVDTWTSFVKASLGGFGLALLAVGPLVPTPESFPFLRQYCFAVGGVLVLAAATMRLRSILIVLGCIALTAGLACTVVVGEPSLNLAAVALYSAAAVILGAAGRHAGMAVPFLLVPLLIVAPQGSGWQASREAFAAAWEAAVGGPYLLAGLPAGLAVVGAAIGHLRIARWTPVKPSAVPVLIATAGLLMASLVVGTLLPPQFAAAQTTFWRIALLAAVLGWVAIAYQIGRVALVWQAATACLLVLAGALFLDRATQFPEAFGPTLAITVAASLVPATLAGLGLLVRRWIGTERPVVPAATERLKGWSEAEQRSFLTRASSAPGAIPTYDPAADTEAAVGDGPLAPGPGPLPSATPEPASAVPAAASLATASPGKEPDDAEGPEPDHADPEEADETVPEEAGSDESGAPEPEDVVPDAKRAKPSGPPPAP